MFLNQDMTVIKQKKFKKYLGCVWLQELIAE